MRVSIFDKNVVGSQNSCELSQINEVLFVGSHEDLDFSQKSRFRGNLSQHESHRDKVAFLFCIEILPY